MKANAIRNWSWVVVAMLGTGACSSAPADPEKALAEGASAPASEPSPAPLPTYREVTLPEGTQLRLELRSTVASDGSKVEDAVRASLRSAVAVDGTTVLPAGTEVTGVVTAAERSGRVQGRAHIAYRFQSLMLDNERINIQTAPLSHEAEATKAADAKKIAGGAAAGAVVGAILGGGDGAAKGAAIGGAGGTGVVLATRGKEIAVGPGTPVTTRLTAPLTVRVPVKG